MKSIRLSLILYMVLLLFLALSTVLLVVYTATLDTLFERDRTTFNSLAAANLNRINALDKQFDDQILNQARFLAGISQTELDSAKLFWELFTLRVLTASTSPDGTLAERLLKWEQHCKHINVPADHLLASTDKNRPPVFAARAVGLLGSSWNGPLLAASALVPDKPVDYFQVYSEDGVPTQRSRSLGSSSFTLANDLRERLKLNEAHFDDTELTPGGGRLRRVTLKAPVANVLVKQSAPLERARGGVFSFPRAEFALDQPTPSRPVPVFFLQYARSADVHEQAVESYKEDFKARVADQEADSANAARLLTTTVLWVGLATFAASLIGGSWLIGLGLAPLKHLSEAVSRVSEKDFRVPFNPDELSAELRPIFDRLTQTLEMLKRAFAREKQAAADISHELRTPLAALLTTLEVGLRRPRTPERYTELLQECHAIGLQMTKLVERLLALARIDAGADSLRSQEVDVGALVHQCADLVRPLAAARDLELQLHCQRPVRVTTDQNKLREIVTNLLHNAIEYNRPQGRIDVVVEQHNSLLQVAVRDTGVGIPPRSLDHIFERFYRVDESRQADGLHAGVGLAIVKGYLDLMGGSIGVQSTEGEGSTFTVRLPGRMG
jgi:signal transduction histidine kinase